MQRKHSILLSALVSLGVALPTAMAAQTADSAPPRLEGRHGHRMAGPAERLLRHRSELQLTEEQVKGLEAIRVKYQEKNQPLIEQVREAREARPESAINQLRANSEAARSEALALLSAQQRQRVEQHKGERRAEGKRRGHCSDRQHRT